MVTTSEKHTVPRGGISDLLKAFEMLMVANPYRIKGLLHKPILASTKPSVTNRLKGVGSSRSAVVAARIVPEE